MKRKMPRPRTRRDLHKSRIAHLHVCCGRIQAVHHHLVQTEVGHQREAVIRGYGDAVGVRPVLPLWNLTGALRLKVCHGLVQQAVGAHWV